MIRTVLFDLDGVLCRPRRDRRLALLASWSPLDEAEIEAAIWRSGFERAGELGLLSADDYLREFGERLRIELTAEQWVAARRAATEPDDEVLALARQLAALLPIAMLTNNPFLLQRHFHEVFPAAAALFGDRAVFSAELGRAKPDPEIYRRLADRLGVAPQEIAYFDDDPTYVAAAAGVGYEAALADGAAGMRRHLAVLGLLPLES